MKKQVIDKAFFLMQGIIGRLDENKDFFEKLEVDFKAGMKVFSMTAELSCEGDGRLEYIFSGVKNVSSADEVMDFICEKMADYEACDIKYYERGRLITLACDVKDAKIINTKTSGETPKTNNPSKNALHGGVYTQDVPMTAVMSKREYLIKPNEAQKLLKVINIMGENGKVKNDMIRKYNQIDHFVELIVPLLESLCQKHGGKKPLKIIDCACGKSYLSFVLNYYIKEVMGRRCYFTGLDYNATVIEDSKKMAAELGYQNMTFVQTDICKYEPEEEYDLLLTLHACDTATDKALGFAMRNNISHIVCVPCCHREMNSQYSLKGFESIMKYGILKARIADALTDGMRANYLDANGYDVSVVEYISPLDTPKNLMIRAEKVRDDVDLDKIKQFCDMCDALGCKLSIAE